MEERNSLNFGPSVQRFLEGALHCGISELESITPTKAGMTNRSYRIIFQGKEYLLRIPGEGTAQLIDRRHEAACYAALAGHTISDHVIAIDPESGIKLTTYWDDTRTCDPESPGDLRTCMALLHRFHQSGITVDHSFDLFGQIRFYQTLMGGTSEYADYPAVLERCMALRPFLEAHQAPPVLSHIDSVCDNFLFVRTGETETVHLIDWEYAGMHDPCIDLAMFIIYSGCDEKTLAFLAEAYYGRPADAVTLLKIRCYAALGGLLWSNWCEYKKQLGVTFGDYAAIQYHYARDWSQTCLQEIKTGGAAL